MNWNESSYEYAEARSSEYFGHLPEQMFEHGAKWQRDQLRADEAVELVAREIWKDSYWREKDLFEDESEVMHELYDGWARSAISALLGDN